jgi:hypothetical protein
VKITRTLRGYGTCSPVRDGQRSYGNVRGRPKTWEPSPTINRRSTLTRGRVPHTNAGCTEWSTRPASSVQIPSRMRLPSTNPPTIDLAPTAVHPAASSPSPLLLSAFPRPSNPPRRVSAPILQRTMAVTKQSSCCQAAMLSTVIHSRILQPSPPVNAHFRFPRQRVRSMTAPRRSDVFTGVSPAP